MEKCRKGTKTDHPGCDKSLLEEVSQDSGASTLDAEGNSFSHQAVAAEYTRAAEQGRQ